MVYDLHCAPLELAIFTFAIEYLASDCIVLEICRDEENVHRSVTDCGISILGNHGFS